MARLRAIFLCIISAALTWLPASAKEPEDTIGTMLDEVEVTIQGRSAIKRLDNGRLRIGAGEVARLNRRMGEADIISHLLGESGIHKAGDYGSGISVDGAAPGQTQYMIDGGPVIFPFRFGGIFSTFNTAHFSGADFSRQAGPDMSPGLGGALNFRPKTSYTGHPSGEANVGLLASSAHISVPMAGRFSLAASGRISYIDQLYRKLIKPEDGDMGYRFADLNATASWRTEQAGTFTLSAFHNSDHLGYEDSHFALDMGLRWRNTLANLAWSRQGSNRVQANAYFTDFHNMLDVGLPKMLLKAPSSTWMTGARLNVDFDNLAERPLHHSSGLNAVYFHTVPQWATLWTEFSEGILNGSQHSERRPMSGFNLNMHESLRWDIIPESLSLLPSARLGIVSCRRTGDGAYVRPILDPQVSLKYTSQAGVFKATAACSSQYLHQIGFSELGLSSDFRIGSSKEAPVERATSFSLRWDRYFDTPGVRCEGAAYCSAVRNQPEYSSQMLEIIDADYDPLDRLTITHGYNYGISAAVRKDFGKITGGVQYEYGGGRRHGAGGRGHSWRSLYDMGHAVKGNIAWRAGEHWILSSDFTYASGRVYTPVKSIYAIGGNLAMEYGTRNSARLPAYQRLDVGATYTFKTKGRIPLTHLVNLTLLNAYGHRNVEMQYFILDTAGGNYRMKRLYSLYRFMPSLSYTIQF